MKKLIILLLYKCIPVIVLCQGHANVGLGYSSTHKPMAEFGYGVAYSRFNIDMEVRPMLSPAATKNDNTNYNAYIGGRLGVNILDPKKKAIAIIPQIGYYYNYIIGDHSDPSNKWDPSESIKIMYTMTLNNTFGIYADIMHIHKTTQFLVGTHIIID